ncbi:hypothetical protein EJ05DRAFT_531537 [Pseudovirgaria hyperparasitica]|uniref:Calcium-transporting ATPase n=1 Tax=Pseudovirgaria hyperparasitica TaxID=470096 RepID=A0A6A6W704_9PEZI|nr:uncharacterized protein EJ05DRAFT_531537 [Pseudovirgaria hyperparasitica]KAF2758325.1 hypothetical protein EJ05DRAFT_531537 [Pseudovirgaria hyperparasitica]
MPLHSASDHDPPPNDGRLGLPRINVENLGGDEPDTISPDPTTTSASHSPTTISRDRSLSQLSAQSFSGRERSMSGSTVATGSHLEPPPPRTPGGASSSASTIMGFDEREDALKPDPNTEADFNVENNCFAFSPGQLNKMQNPKSLQAFVALGGLPGLERGLRTDIDSGLSIDETSLSGIVSFEEASTYYRKARDVEGTHEPRPVFTRTHTSHPDTPATGSYCDRIRVYNRNVLPEKKATPLLKLMWDAFHQDKILILLSVAAVISLALGIYETVGVEHEPGTPMPVDWVEGVAICIAIIVIVSVGSLNDWQKERAFVKLNAKKEDREVKAIRSGKSIMISVHDIMAGDVLHLEPGDLIPVDGIFISGHNVKCDESSATGESDQLKKTGGEQVLRLIEQGHTKLADMDPFIISGSKVLEGVGTYLVTSVGVNSSFGKILMSMRTDMETTPLQVKLNGLAGAIAKLGSAAAGLLFFILVIRFCAELPGNSDTPAEKGSQFIDILITAVTVIVVAVPEGLPLAVTLALAFATTRLVKLNNLVRILKSCETMGNATTVCSDKTGTLTQNKMTVVTGTFGDDHFDDKSQSADAKRNAGWAQGLSREAKRLLVDSIAQNSTAFESDGNNSSDELFIGSKTETALLTFARTVLGMGSLSEERANAQIVQLLPFDSGRKCMGAVQKLPNGTYRFLVKGASEILVRMCSTINTSTAGIASLDASHRENLESVINEYAQQSLRTIALIHRDFKQWPPVEAVDAQDPSNADLAALLHDMNFIGVVGIQDPLRPGVPEAVAKAHHAGVKVRMVTGDNINTARAIATDCGIYTNGIVMEGPEFRTLSHEKMLEILPTLEVLARSSPEDKRILVTKLREMGDIVAVTGDGTNDGPALKAADIGFSMGIAGTEVAKEASAIILMDDNFASILTALMWGRAVNDAVRKFLQFQLTVNITAVVLTFVSALANPNGRPVLTAVQLLWINLIMDSLAALALATDPPTEEILDRKPAKRSAPLISIIMWKMIVGQAVFQLVVTFVMYFAGPQIFNFPAVEVNGSLALPRDHPQLRSMVFNCFVWMQIFNQLNNRRLDNRFNVFYGIHRNYFFVAVNAIMVGAQILIAFVGGRAFEIERLTSRSWAVSIVVALFSLPWAVLIRLFPDAWFAAMAHVVGIPCLFVYRPLSRWSSSFGRSVGKLFKRKGKKSSDDSSEEEGPVAGGGGDKEKAADLESGVKKAVGTQ